MQEIKECRICLESEGNLFSPCLCKGSNAYIHEECLLKMREANPNHLSECPTCKYKYKIQKTFISTVLCEENTIILSMIMSFLVVVLIAFILKIYFILSGTKQHGKNCFYSAIFFISYIICNPILIAHANPLLQDFLIRNAFLYYLYLMHQATNKFLKNYIPKDKILAHH